MINNLVHNLKQGAEEVKQHFAKHGASPSGFVGALQELTLGEYVVKPLDAVLFAGSDPVANLIKRIELHEVVPRLHSPFHELWTHAGILVDKTVLPLDCMEDGKMYIFESVFSGQVAGYVYSKVLPVDHVVPPHGNHLGPQIRDLYAVVDEGDSDVGICPLTDKERQFMEQKLRENPNLILDIYNKYKDFGYPMTNILSVVASASEGLYNDLKAFNTAASQYFPHAKEPKKNTVFCSELVSIVYKEIGHPSFVNVSPDTFTPLEVQVVPEFGSNVFYAKENKVMLLKSGNKLSTGSFATKTQKLIKSLAVANHWTKMPPSGGVPPNAESAGYDSDGQKLYIARVKIGSAYVLGKIGERWECPHISYFGREVQINFGHEVLASLEGTYWEEAHGGKVPLMAVKAGIEEDGTYLSIARAVVGESHGVLGVGKKEGSMTPGAVANGWKGASNLVNNIKSATQKVASDVGERIETAKQNASESKVGQMFNELTLGDYTLKPLDAVLFAGNDPVANLIKRITLHEVVPTIDRPFAELWTHAGILVDKTVLPLDCMEEGKMYIYESVFSGQVAGYVYSKILPVDHVVAPHGNHLGPQIRDFEAVVNEGESNVGICPLNEKEREFLQTRLKENPNLILDIYNKHKDFGYPMTNILTVIASASENLYNQIQGFREAASQYLPQKEEKKNTVFCSELVSIIYKEIGHPSFVNAKPDTFTPLEVQVVPEFGAVYYAKENKVSLLKHGNKVSTGTVASKAQKLLKSLALHDHWVTMPPSGGVPPNAESVGTDLDGTPLYIARVKIGSAYYLGKIGAHWPCPFVTYYEREVKINFGHEVLASLEGTYWEDSVNGSAIPLRALKAGMEENGDFLYVARGVVGEKAGVLGIGKSKGSLAPGVVSASQKGARIAFAGKEVVVEKYDVLCQRLIK
ncbi:hypothetical protein HDU79_004797 [Rhizoclosmatium sp. JEL0117]|nr:hypothetical protein HDU79_004797 [Rhizoclosmatium sp. JEL0117]